MILIPLYFGRGLVKALNHVQPSSLKITINFCEFDQRPVKAQNLALIYCAVLAWARRVFAAHVQVVKGNVRVFGVDRGVAREVFSPCLAFRMAYKAASIA